MQFSVARTTALWRMYASYLTFLLKLLTQVCWNDATRFGAMTLIEFAKFVKPSKLLTAEEESDILSFLVLGPDEEVNMPTGFTRDSRERNTSASRKRKTKKVA
ncbi:hypothetical protein B566_EDAN011263, partial [Ephemera danica]